MAKQNENDEKGGRGTARMDQDKQRDVANKSGKDKNKEKDKDSGSSRSSGGKGGQARPGTSSRSSEDRG